MSDCVAQRVGSESTGAIVQNPPRPYSAALNSSPRLRDEGLGLLDLALYDAGESARPVAWPS